MKKIVTTRNEMWDYLAYAYYNDEFLMNDIIEAQYSEELTNWLIIPKGTEILMPDDVSEDVTVGTTFKAPWEG